MISALSMMMVLSGLSLANGLTTHLWVSEQALLALPEGELRTLLSSEAGHLGLVNGTVFPDGGYAAGSPYGEAAHWEPFQNRYREWLLTEFGRPPYDEEDAAYIGFLFGLGSHGMADQIFDSMFMERSKIYDGVFEPGLDESTDIILVSMGGGHDFFDAFLPSDDLIPLFAEIGVEVDADTLDDGHTLARLEPVAVGVIGADPAQVAEYTALYPWAAEHLLDETVFGSPPREAEVVMAYWQQLYARLQSDAPPEVPFIATFPKDGAYGHPRTLDDVESRITVVFPRGLQANLLGPQAFRLYEGEPGAGGRELPFSINLFYGQDSHTVLLIPGETLAENMRYTVEVKADQVFDREGLLFPVGGSFSFSTAPEPEPDPADDTGLDSGVAGDPKTAGCGCDSGPGASGGWLLGLLMVGARRRAA